MSGLIYALSSARGRSGVAVIRLSGIGALESIKRFIGDGLKLPGRSLRYFRTNGESIDRVLVLTFARGGSFTGEEVIELHCHGSLAVIDAILQALSEIPTARLADIGEFTRRALENGCLDLSQVEGLADLIDAETAAQRRQANAILSKKLSTQVDIWRQSLIEALALVNAKIDFADEGIIDGVAAVLPLIQNVCSDLEYQICGISAAERIRDGFEVALVGCPNVGKSTLLNTLAGRSAALTSEIAGTTRDIIELRMNIGGFAVTLLDMAGLRESANTIEKLGIKQARARAHMADLRIFLTEDSVVGDLGVTVCSDDIVVVSKSDINPCRQGFLLSAKTGFGIEKLLQKITAIFKKRTPVAQFATSERHRLALQRALSYLNAACNLINSEADVAELIAIELQQGLIALDHLIGKVGVEDLLDEIFARFCLGK